VILRGAARTSGVTRGRLDTWSIPEQRSAPEDQKLSSLAEPQESAERTRAVDRVTLLLLASDIGALAAVAAFASLSPVKLALFGMAVLGIFAAWSLYDSRLTLSIVDDLPRITLSVITMTALVSMTANFDAADPQKRLFVGMAVLVTIVCGRTLAYGLIRLARRRGWVTYRTVIIGTGPIAARIGRVLEQHPEHGLRVVGYLGPRSESSLVPADRLLAEDCHDLERVSVGSGATVIVTTLSGVSADDVLDALRTRDPRRPCTLFLVPPLHEMMHRQGSERVRDVPLIRMRKPMLSVLPWRLKRAFDVVASLLLLILVSPVLAVVALAVRWETKGTILFRQERVGRGGHPFTLLKFCSLRPATDEESSQLWSVSHDDRLGRVGRWIRKTSLDELPQLINVLRGDMSLVGPRPERPFFVEQFSAEIMGYALRHRVRPGLTGWAAVNGLRGDTSIEDRVHFDNAYIDNWSLWLDLKVLAQTVVAVLGRRGA
jgi:exopolysaccharide biosynthesis polyprenyl glycosylphosphotransferase